ncbi:MAG: 4Fe-4S binding protein [Anaerolineales bacterium]|nr:4Fe-4S binding protein [Anaerolineales bacterium]
MSLLNAAERFASIDRSQIVLETKRCLHTQDQLSNCAACFDICPVQAITIGKPPALDSEKCESCLACLPVCPVGAFRADDDVADLLTCITHIEDQPVELLCGLHSHPETGTAVESVGIQIHGCLAGLGTGALLTLTALGVKRLTLRADGCSACKWHSLHSKIHLQAEKATRFLSTCENDTITCVDEIESPVERPLWKAKNPPLSRRDLFRMMAKQGQVALARAMENGVSTSKHQPGRDRLRLLSAISHLTSITPTNCLHEYQFASLSISQACTACGACGRACPTEALHVEKNDEAMTYSITFLTKNCIDCGLCDHVCLPDAIMLNHEPTFEEVFSVKEAQVVEAGSLVRCERCKSLMAARDGMKLCPLCEYRRTHPFGSMMPKKVLRESRQ